MRGLGEIQIGIMLFCQENETPRATFSWRVMRNRLDKDRGVLPWLAEPFGGCR